MSRKQSREPMVRVVFNVLTAYALVEVANRTSDPWTSGLYCGASAALLGQACAGMVRLTLNRGG